MRLCLCEACIGYCHCREISEKCRNSRTGIITFEQLCPPEDGVDCATAAKHFYALLSASHSEKDLKVCSLVSALKKERRINVAQKSGNESIRIQVAD